MINVIRYRYPHRDFTTPVYDARGQLVQIPKPGAPEPVCELDEKNRVIRITHADGTMTEYRDIDRRSAQE